MTYRALVVAVVGTVLSFSTVARAADAPAAELIDVKKIWDKAPHNAFTDLIRFKGAWYCVFREGSSHVPGLNGTIRVLRSKDGDAWESAALIAEKDVDLRDPKIDVTPDGRLMIVMGGSIYGDRESMPKRRFVTSHSRVTFSADAVTWTPPQPVEGIADLNWLWRVTWHGGTGYGAVYGPAKDGKGHTLTIWTTVDGVKYAKLTDSAPPVDCNEATIRFTKDDTMVVLVRSGAKAPHAWIGSGGKPYDKLEWRDAGQAVHGPNFVVTGDGRMFYAGRDFGPKGASLTRFGVMTRKKVEPQLTLPSGGDTSYPGIVDAGDGTIWVSYYSSHEEKKASIYLARVRVGVAK